MANHYHKIQHQQTKSWIMFNDNDSCSIMLLLGPLFPLLNITVETPVLFTVTKETTHAKSSLMFNHNSHWTKTNE